jgi:oxygen-independent coproporphyrinogen-3 oxidase
MVSALPGALAHVTLVEPQTPDLQFADTAILALRLNEGLDVRWFEQRYGARFDEVYGKTVSEMAAVGLLQRANGSVRLTARGRLLANEVFARLLPD